MGYLSPADHKRESSGRYTPAEGTTPNESNVYKVTWADLPLNCPLPSMSLWNSHPKVYLPIHNSGHERCPYCSAEYTLVPPTPGEEKPFFRGDADIERAYYEALEEAEQKAKSA